MRRVPLQLLLLLVASQSPAMFAHGAACGAYATFGPDPVLAMQDLTITVSNAAQYSNVVYHGNSDGTCLDGLSEYSTGTNTVTIDRDQQMTMFRGSNTYRMCQGGVELCTVNRLVPLLNSRNGGFKPVSTPPAASHLCAPDPPAGSSFTLYLFSGTTSFATLRGALGYTMDVALSADRNCTTRSQEILDAVSSWSATSMFINFGGEPKGFYSICLRLWRSGSVQADWHPTTSLLGDSTHNVAVGFTSRANWVWSAAGVTDHLQYGAPVTLYLDIAVLTSDYQYFAIDTSPDVCGPAVRSDFGLADLSAYNATHASGTITVSRPYGSPAGGMSALCGATGPNTPWVRVSFREGPSFHFCDANSGLFLSSNDRYTCTYCSPNSTMPCHDNGDCWMTFEDKTYFLQSQTCSCYNRFYGSLCEWYDLDAPTFTVPAGTYDSLALPMTINPPAPGDSTVGVNLTYSDGTTIICWIQCNIVLKDNTTLTAFSIHVNGSRSSAVSTATYWLIPRTPTMSRTVTCGDIALFGVPQLAMRHNLWTMTILDSVYNNLVVHGNDDNTCLDSYNILGSTSSSTITITKDDEWMRFHGSKNYHLCHNDVHVCSTSRLVPVRSSNQGTWRPGGLPEAALSWTGGPGIPFSVLVFSGDNDYTALRANGYAFDFMLSRHRNCSTSVVTYLDASVIFLGAGAFFSVTAKPLGIYSLCIRVSVASVVTADWAPISAMLGHSDGNLNLGFLRAHQPNWTATPITGSRLRYGQQVTITVDASVQGSGMVHFGIDTGAHVCSTFLDPHFTVSDLVAINATHWEVNTTIDRPYGLPGGGEGILCGAFGADEPWVILSPLRSDIFYECDSHGGIWRTDLNTCVYCSPSESIPMCHDVGTCSISRENKTQMLQELTTCTCDDRFYGNYCEYYRLDPPVFSLPNGTYKTRSVLEVNVTTTNPDTEGIHLTFGNGTTYACPSTCMLRFFENVTVTTYAFHTNGSVSFLSTAWYNLIDPTWTLSHTETELVALSPTKTISRTESLTEERTSTLTQEQTRSQNTKSESLEICKLLNPSVTTVYLLEPDWTETVGPFTGSCTPCSTVCSAGLRLNCSALTLEVLHVAPEQHWCNMTAGVATFHWGVYIAPRRPRQSELSTRTEPVAVEVNSKYLPINVPYMARGLEWTYKKCGSDRAINISTSMFNMLPSDTNTACFDVNVSGSGFTNATGSVSGPAARVTTSAKAKAEESINSASNFTEIVLFTKNWAFYLIALAVGIEFLVLFLMRAKRRWSMRPTTEGSDEL